MAKQVKMLDLSKELSAMLDEYQNEVLERKEKSLDKASDYLVGQMKASSPVRTGAYKQGWMRTEEYQCVRYIGNTSTTTMKGRTNVPLSTMLEYSKKHGSPHIRRTFEENKEAILKIIKEELSK